MTLRTVVMSLLAASVAILPAGAGQPDGYAGKLIANPPIALNVGDPNGLPSVLCTGFSWTETFPAHLLDPADTVLLELAIVPFRSGSTEVLLPELLRLPFADGHVNGLPYHRSAWNDVRVWFRPATQDYMLSVNGVEAGPFPNEFPCQQMDCFTLKALLIRGGVFEEAVAWIDSLSLVRQSSAGQELVLQNTFEACYAGQQNVILGGLLIATPPEQFTRGGRAVGNP